MRFNLLHGCYMLLYLVLVTSHVVTPEVYWKHVLPNTPMPKAIKESLSEWNDQKSTASIDELKHELFQWLDTYGGSYIGVGRGVHSRRREKPLSVGVHPMKSPFIYHYASSEDQLNDDPNVALFFLEKDLYQGTKMSLHFTKTDQKTMFLPRKLSDSIPFSSNDLPQIYNHFAIKPHSMEAEEMKQTLSECENKGIEGEEKYCATSLESMIDFVTTKLGKKINSVSTEVNARKSAPLQKYKIELARKVIGGNKVVVCHKERYPYTVFYCHKTDGTRVYEVSMVGDDGMRVNAVAVCHIDTGKWNPKHLAFQVLKVKPGSVPVCHFLPEDHVVWIPY